MKKQWFYFVLAFLLPVFGILWWWGVFAAVTLEVAKRGPYRYAYLEAQGSYTKLGDKYGESNWQLRQNGIDPGAQVTVIFDDPRHTSAELRKARAGYLVPEQATVPVALQSDRVPARRVLLARVKAHPAIAYGKAYGALLEYIEQKGLDLHLPTLEFYDNGVLTVEMPLETAP